MMFVDDRSESESTDANAASLRSRRVADALACLSRAPRREGRADERENRRGRGAAPSRRRRFFFSSSPRVLNPKKLFPPTMRTIAPLTSVVLSFVVTKQYKLCKVNKKRLGDKGVPCVNLHDGRTIRYPDPLINEHDSVMVDIATNKITEFIKYEAGALVMLTGGRNAGRVGVVTRREKHKGSFEIVHVKDASGHEFATRASNAFVIGTGNKPLVSLPKGKGLRMSIVEELEKRKEK